MTIKYVCIVEEAREWGQEAHTLQKQWFLVKIMIMNPQFHGGHGSVRYGLGMERFELFRFLFWHFLCLSTISQKGNSTFPVSVPGRRFRFQERFRENGFEGSEFRFRFVFGPPYNFFYCSLSESLWSSPLLLYLLCADQLMKLCSFVVSACVPGRKSPRGKRSSRLAADVCLTAHV